MRHLLLSVLTLLVLACFAQAQCPGGVCYPSQSYGYPAATYSYSYSRPANYGRPVVSRPYAYGVVHQAVLTPRPAVCVGPNCPR